MCFSSLVLSRRPKILKKRPKPPQKKPHSYRLMPGFTYYCHVVGPSPGEKPHFSKKCVPLLHETIFFQEMGAFLHEATLFQEMCAPLTRNHTFSRNVCPSCTKPHFLREMCAPLARNHTFLQKHRKPHAWIREQLSKSAHLPDPTHAGTK